MLKCHLCYRSVGGSLKLVPQCQRCPAKCLVQAISSQTLTGLESPPGFSTLASAGAKPIRSFNWTQLFFRRLGQRLPCAVPGEWKLREGDMAKHRVLVYFFPHLLRGSPRFVVGMDGMQPNCHVLACDIHKDKTPFVPLFWVLVELSFSDVHAQCTQALHIQRWHGERKGWRKTNMKQTENHLDTNFLVGL